MATKNFLGREIPVEGSKNGELNQAFSGTKGEVAASHLNKVEAGRAEHLTVQRPAIPVVRQLELRLE
ncbi:MAG: hypothetical protein KGH94_04585 [Candidatus Micrarchaeota archaeon]|nr:hypothetical protein [Candidatus Micrarchaeota archaeon]